MNNERDAILAQGKDEDNEETCIEKICYRFENGQ